MAYATITDLLKDSSEVELLQLADDAQTGNIADAAVQSILTDALSDASGLIESYAAARYTVPFAMAPAVIVRHTTTIALYLLFLRREVLPEPRKEAYLATIRWLEHLAKGVVTLGVEQATAAPAPEAAVGGPQSTSEAMDRIFTRDTLARF